ncbi:sigma-70 family RNA polymerase sigma factor [Pelomonas sp. V22]|uniref:ECF-type sigma factor n=1 Tax=Pelomonas sp. V22 TaxID=2822139 RepID=UPI0024A7F9D0|nr:ECF-type sigma factor [Pelomonas sp. V22]MDI4631424.1 sigma-70 family RNA polymerase sigma factor [Pelomonas sp. V22]
MNDPDDVPQVLGDALWNEAFNELKLLARSRLRTVGSVTQLNTTALVHESYLKLSQRVGTVTFPSRNHFFAYVSKVMRSVIVDLVRERNADRRGGGLIRVTLETEPGLVASEDEPLQLDEALRTLEQVEPRLAQVVEMRYYAGMTEIEIAEVLQVTDRTVRRDWEKARAILKTMLS